MSGSVAPALGSGALMDSIYRLQRHCYDATRKYYLFGRDRLIDGLALEPGASVLEVGCGTGRNLAKIARRWPEVELFGFDISSEMLKTARRKLGPRASLALGDATRFDPMALFGRADFDCVVLSYATSMMPGWQSAVAQAAAAAGKRGSLHIVDFGDMAGLSPLPRALLRRWLAAFHVTPRVELVGLAKRVAAEQRMAISTRRGPAGYYVGISLCPISLPVA